MDFKSILTEAGARILESSKILSSEIEDKKTTLEKQNQASRTISSLVTGYRPTCFGSSSEERCFFVSSYITNGKELTGLSGIMVLEAMVGTSWHKPHPTGESNSQRMISTKVGPKEVAEKVMSLYVTGAISLGTSDEVLIENCSGCGNPSPIICRHDFDYDSECQSLVIERLCLACPLSEKVAHSITIDCDDPHPILKPRVVPKKRRRY